MSEGFSLQGRRPPARPPPGSEPGEAAWDIDQERPASAPGEAPQAAGAGPAAAEDPMAALLLETLRGDGDGGGTGVPGLDIVRLLLGCWRRRLLVAAIAVAVTALFVALALTTIDHTWTATTVLIKRDTDEDLILGDGKAFSGKTYSTQTLLDTLKLPSSLDAVMQRSNLQLRRTSFAAAIDVVVGRESEVLLLKATWDNPRTAATIANHMADVFLETTVDLQHREAREALAYYSDQLASSRLARRKADQALLAFEKTHQVSDFDAETQVRLGALASLESDHEAALSAAQAAKSSAEDLRARIAEQPEMIIEQTIYRSPLKQRLTNYEWELQEARSRYTAENPKVQKLQQKVDVLNRMIGASKDESVPENSYAPNTYRIDLELKLIEQQQLAAAADANAQALAQSLESTKQKLAFLSAREKEHARLKSRQASSREIEERLMQRVEEVRLQSERTEPAFDVLEPATPPPEPNPSGRKLVAAAGVVLGGGLGVGIAILLELLDPLVRTRRDGAALSGVELCLEWGTAGTDGPQLTADDEHTARLFWRLAGELEALHPPAALQSLCVLATESGTAHDFVAANLALCLVAREEATLLIDASPRDDSGAGAAALCGASDAAAGLGDVLQGSAPLAEAVVAPGAHPGLRVLAPGALTGQGLALLAGKRMGALVAQLRQSERRIVYNLPAADQHDAVPEAAAAIGSVVLVMRSGGSRRSDVAALVAALDKRQASILAAMVIDVPARLLEQKPPRPRPRGLLQRLTGRAEHA